MSTELRIPRVGMGTEEGKLVEWLAVDGQAVKEGDLLYSLESDKTVSDIEAPVSGVLKILAAADEVYEVGALIGSIE